MHPKVLIYSKSLESLGRINKYVNVKSVKKRSQYLTLFSKGKCTGKNVFIVLYDSALKSAQTVINL
jgi:hypothetical protein